MIDALPYASGPPLRRLPNAEQRQVVAGEDVERLAEPFVGVAVELVDFLDMR